MIFGFRARMFFPQKKIFKKFNMYEVFTYKVDAMKCIQTAAARGGYTRYTSGTIEPKKLESFLYKLEDRYRISATKQMRYRAKKRGEANTTLVLLQGDQKIHFWLMVSPGTGAVVECEKLCELKDKKNRLIITSHELVRVQKSDKVTWTWRMTNDNYAEFEQRIKNACRHKNSDHIEQCFYSLQRMPVFSEMRKQCFALFKLLQAEYKRSHKEDYPKKLIKNFYGRYKVAQKIDAIALSRKAKRNLSDLELYKLHMKRNRTKYEKEIIYNILDLSKYFNATGAKLLNKYKLTKEEIAEELKPLADFANNKIKHDNAYTIRLDFENIKNNLFDMIKKALVNNDKNKIKSEILIKIDDFINQRIADDDLSKYEAITRDAIRSDVLHFINENATR